jgi:hypothetical protein
MLLAFRLAESIRARSDSGGRPEGRPEPFLPSEKRGGRHGVVNGEHAPLARSHQGPWELARPHRRTPGK